MDHKAELGLAKWLLKRIPVQSSDPLKRELRQRADIMVWLATLKGDKFFKAKPPKLLSEEVGQLRPELLVEWRLSQ